MILVDPRSPVPPFEQIRVQLLTMIGSAELPPGSRLPTVRKLAADLEVAPNTVARAYRELELSGVIESKGRHGTFVSYHEDPVKKQAQKAALDFADVVRKLRLSEKEAVDLLCQALRGQF